MAIYLVDLKMFPDINYDLCSSRHCNVCLLFHCKKKDDMPTNHSLISTEKLYKCNGCKLVMYCGVEHQKLDWPIHRDFCRAARQIVTAYNIPHPHMLNGIPTTANQMEQAIIGLKFLMSKLLGRSLEYQEEEFITFPMYCAVCFKFGRLQTCAKCSSVSYCSEEHSAKDAERHEKNCELLQLFYSRYKVQSDTKTVISPFYRKVNDLHKKDLKNAFESATLKMLPDNPIASLSDYQLFSTASDYSCIASICFTLGFMDMSNYHSTKFVIYIVGATMERHCWFREIHTRFFFLQFPKIKFLELYFIGPETAEQENKEVTYRCQGRSHTVRYISYRGLFQDFCNSCRAIASLIACFNCGFSENSDSKIKGVEKNMIPSKENLPGEAGKQPDLKEVSLQNDTWSPGLSAIIQMYGIPILFTSYTKLEAELDYGALLDAANNDCLLVRVDRLFNVIRNPFRDMRPLRNWQITYDEEIYYRNGYIQAVCTQMGQ